MALHRRGPARPHAPSRFFTLQTIEELFASNGLALEKVFKRVDGGWNIRLLNALSFGYLRNTLYLHYIVRVRAR